MKNLSKNSTILHAIIEKDVQVMQFGTISYTIFIDADGEPNIKTLKVTKSKRIKYQNGK